MVKRRNERVINQRENRMIDIRDTLESVIKQHNLKIRFHPEYSTHSDHGWGIAVRKSAQDPEIKTIPEELKAEEITGLLLESMTFFLKNNDIVLYSGNYEIHNTIDNPSAYWQLSLRFKLEPKGSYTYNKLFK